MTTSLSIIIPVYNGERYLDQLFGTLSTQGIFEPETRIPVELILIDDGSTDGSAGIIRSYMERYPGVIRCHHQENAGQAAARNKGIDMARMKYVYMMDQDDILVPDMLIPMTLRLEQDGSDMIRFGFREVPSSEMSEVAANLLALGEIHTRIVRGRDYIRMTDYLSGETTIWTTVVRRDFLNRNAIRFDPSIRMIDDYLFNMHMFLVDPRVSVCDNCGIIYINYPESDCHNLEKGHVWSRRPSFALLSDRIWDILEDGGKYVARDKDIDEWLEKVKSSYLVQYWFLAIRWMPDNRDVFENELTHEAGRGMLRPRSGFPFRLKPFTPAWAGFRLVWAGMKHPSLMRMLLSGRSAVKKLTGR